MTNLMNLQRLLTLIALIWCSSGNAQIELTFLKKKIDHSLSQKQPFKQNNSDYEITSSHISSISGAQHIYFRQTFEGVAIEGTESSLHIAANGDEMSSSIQLISISNQKKAHLSKANDPLKTLEAVLQQLKIKHTQKSKV